VFISETPVFLQGSYYTLPTQNVNLADPAYFGPTNVKNSTFYVYVELILGEPELVFLRTKNVDTTKFIYIGTIDTDNLGIVSSHFEKISKIDSLQVNGTIGIGIDPEPNYAILTSNTNGAGSVYVDGNITSTGILAVEGDSIRLGTVDENTDNVKIERVDASNDVTELRLVVGDNPTGAAVDKVSIGYSNSAGTTYTEAIGLGSNGAITCSNITSTGTYTGGATLGGTPTAPTASSVTNNTQIATTAFVHSLLSNNVSRPKYVGITGINSGGVTGTGNLTGVTGLSYDSGFATRNGTATYTISQFTGTGLDTSRITELHIEALVSEFANNTDRKSFVRASYPDGTTRDILAIPAANGNFTSSANISTCVSTICRVPINSDTATITITINVDYAAHGERAKFNIIGATTI
jgi:hypothetical protein